MRVVVMGGGVVGVTTAYQLLHDGHEVVLLEKNPDVALETSWGNAGMIAPGHSFVWASPRAPIILLRSLVLKNQALRFRPSLDPRLWRWSLQIPGRMHQLEGAPQHAAQARDRGLFPTLCTRRWRPNDRLRPQRPRHPVFLSRPESLDAGVAHMQLLADDGQPIRVLDRQQMLDSSLAVGRCGPDCGGGPLSDRRERELQQVHHGSGGDLPGGRGGDPDRYGNRPASYRGRYGDRRDSTAGLVDRRSLFMALGCRSPMLARDLGVVADLSDQRLFDDDSVGNHRAPPTVEDDRREQPGGDLSHGRTGTGDRHCRIRRLGQEPQAGGFHFHEGRRAGVLS